MRKVPLLHGACQQKEHRKIHTHPHTNTRSFPQAEWVHSPLCLFHVVGGGAPVGVSWPHSRPRPSSALGCVLTGVGGLGWPLTVRAAVEEVGGHLPLALHLDHTTALQLVAPTGQHIIQVCGDLWVRGMLSVKMIGPPSSKGILIFTITPFHSSTNNHICICLLMTWYYDLGILFDMVGLG